jgi:hypothetical protein
MAAIPQGAIRFNTDSQKLEFYAQDQWWEMVIDTPALAVSSNTGAGARGLFAGGYNPTSSNVIDYINISSTGNAVDFGDLLRAHYLNSGFSSSIRGVFSPGYAASSPSTTNTIEYVTISSTGNSTTFGSLNAGFVYGAGCASNSTRGLIAGYYQLGNTIDYVTTASTGNSQDFGDLTDGRAYPSGCSSSTRALFGGGFYGDAQQLSRNTIDYVSIATIGNAIDFGDLSTIRTTYGGAISNPIRGIFTTGSVYPGASASYVNDYVTIASRGNASNFGSLSVNRFGTMQVSSPTRGVFAGGLTFGSPANSYYNVIDYILISTQGTAVDFGDLTSSNQRGYGGSCSNAHGGL